MSSKFKKQLPALLDVDYTSLESRCAAICPDSLALLVQRSEEEPDLTNQKIRSFGALYGVTRGHDSVPTGRRHRSKP
jgi:hypothetical protein